MHGNNLLTSTMNLNYDTFIKQEVFTAEDELLTTVSSPLNPNLNIPVKNEPITDDPPPPLITIKNEPISQETFTEGAVTIKTENQLQNHATIPGDSFIIYELETPPVTTLPILPAPNLQNEQQLFKQTNSLQVNSEIPALTITQPKQVALNTTIAYSTLPLQSFAPIPNPVTNKPASAKANTASSTTAPPVLLNAQLRKRQNKVILPVNPIDKRTRYNIEGSTTKPLNKLPTDPTKSTKILNKCRTLNAASNKKIINHLIKHKQLNQSKPKESTTKIPDIILPQQETIEHSVPAIEQRLSPLILPNIEETTTANIQTEIKQEILSSPPLTNPAKLENSLPLTNETKDLPPPPLMPELRVKCLCSLTAGGGGDSTTDNADLKDFFQKMFEETRRLNRTQQRKVKMSLLQAVSDAEELMEQGKCCGF